MTLNLEGLRRECGKRIYDKTMKAGMLNTPWHDLDPEVRMGFERMVGEVFDVLFAKNPADVIEFFTGIEVKVEKKNGK